MAFSLPIRNGTGDDCRLLKQAVEMLDEDGKATVNEMRDVLTLVRERLIALMNRTMH